MKKMLKPVYILLFISLPQFLLAGYLIYGFSLLNSTQWLAPIILSISMNAIFTGYALLKRKADIPDIKVYIAISAAYGLYLLLGIFSLEGTSFPRDNISARLMLMVLSLIPALYGLLGVAYHTTPAEKKHTMPKYIAGLFAIPLVWFIAANLIYGVRRSTLMLIVIIAFVYAALFIIMKILLVWNQKSKTAGFSLELDPKQRKKNMVITLIVMLILPLLGLWVNQSFAGFGGDSNFGGVFGDFSSPIFYLIAAANGLLLLLPPVKCHKLRLMLFYLKTVGLPYILYFFIIFVPILPLGFFGIFYFGLGLLIFAPTAAAIWQCIHLYKEWIILRKEWKMWRVTAVFCAGLLTLPLCTFTAIWGDKANFEAASQYLTQVNEENMPPVHLQRLKRTLNLMKGSITGDTVPSMVRLDSSQGYLPILSGIYSNLILDGKVASPENIMVMENLFFDAGHNLNDTQLSDPMFTNRGVALVSVNQETKYDAKNGIYRSWIHLQLKNNTNEGNGEYVTTFTLPEGAYISDYYLNVFGEKKKGILTHRRAAQLMYSKIVNTQRDPGLLHYIGKNTLELRVFPFAAGEMRETGFEILHTGDLRFLLGQRLISLKGNDTPEGIKVDGAALLSPSEKENLPSVKRKPKYYFVIDGSKNSDTAWHIEQVEAYTKVNHITEADVIFASYRLKTYPLSDLKNIKFKTESGFNLDMAVRTILQNESKDYFPVIIAVSDNMPGAVFPRNIYPLADRYPETPYYYALNHNLTLTPYSFDDNSTIEAVDSPVILPVLEYKGHLVADNGENELVLMEPEADHFITTGNQYKNALLIDAMIRRESATGNGDTLPLIRASFRSRILTPYTAFIVVETPEQEQELLDLQERILNNEEIPMITLDEPPLLLCLLLLPLVIFIRRKKSQGTVP